MRRARSDRPEFRLKLWVLLQVIFFGVVSAAGTDQKPMSVQTGKGPAKSQASLPPTKESSRLRADPFMLLAQGDLVALLKISPTTLKSARNEHGETLLIKAILDQKVEAAHQLIRFSEVGALDQSRNDALIYAVTGGEISLTKELLKAGAPLDRLYDEAGENIAFEAARGGNPLLLEILLKASPNLASGVNTRGQGLIEVALEAAQSETALALARSSVARAALSAERRSHVLRLLPEKKSDRKTQQIRALLESAP